MPYSKIPMKDTLSGCSLCYGCFLHWRTIFKMSRTNSSAMQHAMQIPRMLPAAMASAKYQVVKIHDRIKTHIMHRISKKPINTFHHAGNPADEIHVIKSRCLSHRNLIAFIAFSLIIPGRGKMRAGFCRSPWIIF